MITKLENSNSYIAEQIYHVFQSAYKIEAGLIGTLNFPPLSRSSKDIENSTTQFYGFTECLNSIPNNLRINGDLAAVIEVNVDNNQLNINSLTVAPAHFRKGIADKLMHYILNQFDYSQAIVETAVVNTPAINLYKKHGFVEFKRWVPSHGIEKLAMSVNASNLTH